MKYYWTRYVAIYPTALLYMLQDTEYRLDRYIAWYFRTRDFRHVMKRRTLELTKKVRLLRIGIWSLWLLANSAVAVCIYMSVVTQSYTWGVVALGIIALLPFILAFGVIIPLIIGRLVIQLPRERAIIEEGRAILAKHTGTRIAVAGSYGKTTAKEILLTILHEGVRVAATPGNMNTAIGISRFARKLKGDEEVLIVELGEEQVGDVKQLASLTRPTMGVITGVNEAHLVSFKSLEQTAATIFELADYLGKDATTYKNGENKIVASRAKADDNYVYSEKGVNGWKVSHLTTTLEGTQFIATKGAKIVKARTKLIGRHVVGVTVAAIAIADSLGLTAHQIEAGLAKIRPFEHRMEPRKLHGAWIVDDTYNGNSDGVIAGLKLLKESQATRRIYVTPGLVEQGDKTKEVHELIGRLAARSADMIVLMKNSVTDYIVAGLQHEKFAGELRIIDEPLEFYTNIEHFVAAGDVVLMQNDWTDNYV